MEASIVIAIAIVLIIEGLLPALFPNRWRAYLLKVSEMPINTMRLMGVVSLVIGGIILLLNH